jgi:hypothetical protein
MDGKKYVLASSYGSQGIRFVPLDIQLSNISLPPLESGTSTIRTQFFRFPFECMYLVVFRGHSLINLATDLKAVFHPVAVTLLIQMGGA